MSISENSQIAIVGGGPSGLMAAEVLAAAGHSVTVYEQKPSLGRKFLMAGRGGLNLTHSEDISIFITRYGTAADRLAAAIKSFPPSALRAWCESLGQEVFVGTSGRVFPKAFKASPLLRAWIARLEQLNVKFELGQRWQGWDDAGNLIFTGGNRAQTKVKPAATLFALGGASWPKLGSDGGWAKIFADRNILLAPFQSANCGFIVEWSDIFRARYIGQPFKSITVSFKDVKVPGEIMITENGIEGGPVYALSAALRNAIAAQGKAILHLDMRPNMALNEYIQKLRAPRGALSFTNYLRKFGGLSPIATGLLMERADRKTLPDLPPEELAALIKSFPLELIAPFDIDRAISTAGGIMFDAVDENFMLKHMPGVFVAGEMLDWEAPTGGYLLQACFATAKAAAEGMKLFFWRVGSVN